jgi:hypothetical protein
VLRDYKNPKPEGEAQGNVIMSGILAELAKIMTH